MGTRAAVVRGASGSVEVTAAAVGAGDRHGADETGVSPEDSCRQSWTGG